MTSNKIKSGLIVRRFAMIVALVFLAVMPDGDVMAENPQEHKVKAAMVYNMAKFVEWPESTFPDSSSPLLICVIGRGPLPNALEEYQGKTAKGHPLSIHRMTTNEAGSCHILLVSGIENRHLASALASARKLAVLTISDMPNFANKGGVVGLVEQEGKVRLEINLKAAQSSNLKISAQLLKLARIVRDGEQ